MRQLSLVAAAAAALVIAASAQAVTVTPGNNPQPGEEFIVLPDQGLAATVTGTSSTVPTNTLSISGTTTAGNQFTVTSGAIFPSSGLITQLTITGSSPLQSLILDAVNGSGTMDISVTMTDATVESVGFLGLGNGLNFFTIVGGTSPAMQSVTLTASSGFERIRDFRAVFLPSTHGAVPEPASWAMMLIGFGAIGGAMRRRRRVALA